MKDVRFGSSVNGCGLDQRYAPVTSSYSTGGWQISGWHTVDLPLAMVSEPLSASFLGGILWGSVLSQVVCPALSQVGFDFLHIQYAYGSRNRSYIYNMCVYIIIYLCMYIYNYIYSKCGKHNYGKNAKQIPVIDRRSPVILWLVSHNSFNDCIHGYIHRWRWLFSSRWALLEVASNSFFCKYSWHDMSCHGIK